MRTGELSKVLSLVALLLFVGLLAGCGGGNQSEQGGQGDDAGGGQGDVVKKNAPEAKIAIGRILSVKSDKRRIVLKPVEEAQSGERMIFKVRKRNVTIQLGGEKADLSDIERGQQAQIEYIVRNERNRARAIELFEAGDGGGNG